MKEKYIDQYGTDSLPNLKNAAARGSDYFMTTNEDLLDDKEELEEYFNILIRTPRELMDPDD